MKILFFGLAAFLTAFGFVAYAAQGEQQEIKNVVILLGAPGSGKGTQAKMLSQEMGLPHISTGDLFRENLSQGTPLGKKVKGYIESGNLVPDEIVIDMLKERVAAPDCHSGFILDGFPRSIPQAEALDKELKKGNPNIIALNIAVDDEKIVKRIVGRRSCSECGAIYHVEFSPPSTSGVCDKCKGILQQRSDDKADVVLERLRVYHSQTQPLEDYYAKMGIFKSVDGDQPPQQVFTALLSAVKENR